MKAGNKIRIQIYMGGVRAYTEDHVVEEFRHCLGIFRDDEHRTAGSFTPLCDLYEPGPYTENKYISNFGDYQTDMIQGWMDLA